MAKNYYIILGIPSTATQAEIKAAYRQLVKELHPDHYGEDTGPFMDVQEAYLVLGDPVRRLAYDKMTKKERSQKIRPHMKSEPIGPKKSPIEPLIPTEKEPPIYEEPMTMHLQSFRLFHPSFDEIFNRIWSNFSSISRPKAEKPESLNVEITIGLEDAYHGGHVKIMVPARAICPICQGRGHIGFYDCWQCKGEGGITGKYPVLISFPPGIPDNYMVRVPLDRFGIHNFYLTVYFRISENE